MIRRTTLATASLAVLLAGAIGTSAAADTYPPPATGAGQAAPTRVKQGHCTRFSGDGFAATASVVVYDDNNRYGNTESDDKGGFTSRVCFANDAHVGGHVLTARGPNQQTLPTDPSQREVTATVTVVGAEQTSDASDVDSANAAHSTPLTSPFPVAVIGLLLLPLISGVLLLLEQRHRRRRRAA